MFSVHRTLNGNTLTFGGMYSPANINDVLMLVHRLRRWPNIKTILLQRFVYDSLRYVMVHAV